MSFLLAISLVASTSSTTVISIPAQVRAHVKDGHFDAGNYDWLRGAFPGASDTQTADWKAISDYADHCGGSVPNAVRSKMTSMGYQPPANYWRHYVSDVCGELAIPRHTVHGFDSWTSYRNALDAALPYYRTFLFAVARAQAAISIDVGTLRDRLQAVVVPDQMLRAATSWGDGDAADAPALDPQAKTVLTTLLWRPIRDIDHRNTVWLKNAIAKDGWPSIPKVGRVASGNAWLLAQHADDDPVFQIHVLRLITPLADKGEVDRQNYALLYDRVMLPLTGKQRYGTQFTCDAKGWHPKPLESENELAKLRQQVGLDPIADRTKQFVAQYGSRCPG